MESNFPFVVYKKYLVQVARKENRAFRLPKTNHKFLERNDYKLFVRLATVLYENGIITQGRVDAFLEYSRTQLEDFHVTDILADVNNLIKLFKKIKQETTGDLQNKVRKSFDNLKEFIILKHINNYEELNKGQPPLILKLWKEGLIIEEVIACIYDFDAIKKRPWARLYCGDIISRVPKIRDKMKQVDLISNVESELLKVKKMTSNG